MNGRAGTAVDPGPRRTIAGSNRRTPASNTDDMNPARTSDNPGPSRGALDPTSSGRPLIRRTPATAKTPGGPG